jgi:hypothetical protein
VANVAVRSSVHLWFHLSTLSISTNPFVHNDFLASKELHRKNCQCEWIFQAGIVSSRASVVAEKLILTGVILSYGFLVG